jgi:serine/threonine-protein kinase RsbW
MSAASATNKASVSIRKGPLVGPVLGRVVGMLAARAQCPIDRLDDAMLLTDAVAAHAPTHTTEGHVQVVVAADATGIELRVGALARGGAEPDGTAPLGLHVVAGPALERLRERGDERQAEAEARAVGAREDPAPLVAHDDAQHAVHDGRAQRDRAFAAGIRVDDDVRARLGHGQLDVRERLVRDVQHVGESADRVACHGDILRAGRQRELEIGCVSVHAAFRGKRSGHAGGTGGDSARPRRVLCMSSLDPPVE